MLLLYISSTKQCNSSLVYSLNVSSLRPSIMKLLLTKYMHPIHHSLNSHLLVSCMRTIFVIYDKMKNIVHNAKPTRIGVKVKCFAIDCNHCGIGGHWLLALCSYLHVLPAYHHIISSNFWQYGMSCIFATLCHFCGMLLCRMIPYM